MVLSCLKCFLMNSPITFAIVLVASVNGRKAYWPTKDNLRVYKTSVTNQ